MPLPFSYRRLFALLETLVDRYPLPSKAGTSFFLSQPSIAAFTSRGLGLKSQVQLAASREQRQLFHRWQYNAARAWGLC